MNERTQDRLFAACGIAFVVLELAGAGIATAGGKTHNLTITSSSAQIARALAKPSGAFVWVGSYLEVLSFGAFLAFAVWACAKLGSGLLAQVGRAAATSYATLSIASLAVMGAIAYRAGHGLAVQLGSTLVTVNEALYICTWFLSAFFLLAAGLLALGSARQALGWGAIAIAVLSLSLTAASTNDLGQMAVLLWLAWIVWASISLARGPRTRAGAMAMAPIA
jgi:hypothetical protein